MYANGSISECVFTVVLVSQGSVDTCKKSLKKVAVSMSHDLIEFILQTVRCIGRPQLGVCIRFPSGQIVDRSTILG